MKFDFDFSKYDFKINFVTIYQLIKKYMCKKKVLPRNPKKAILFEITDYKGSNHDLHGCINDHKGFIKALYDFEITYFRNKQVTVKLFISELNKAITNLIYGDTLVIHYSGHGTQVIDKNGDESDHFDEGLYVWDGVVIDDDIHEALMHIPMGATVVIFLDSCFSGTATKHVYSGYKKGKFIPGTGTFLEKKRSSVFKTEQMNWIVFSGCSENQTSDDAFIDGKYWGAFSYYALKTISRDLNYKEWYEKIRQYLPSYYFDQIPTLEGPEELLIKKVFN